MLFFFSTFSVYCCKITLIRQLNSTPGPCHCHHGYIIFFFRSDNISRTHLNAYYSAASKHSFCVPVIDELDVPHQGLLRGVVDPLFLPPYTHSLTRSVASRGHFVGGRPGDHHAALAATATAAASTSAVVTPHCEQNWF